MNIKFAVAASLFFAAAGVSAKSENAPLGMEVETKGGSKIMSLDFESSGDAASFTFRVVFPDGAKQIDASRCLSELPKGFIGVCKVYDGKIVAVTVVNNEGGVFPAGLNRVGKLSYVSNSKSAPVIDTFEASDRNGEVAQMGSAKVQKLD
ncbi:MAG: hypothetical protein IPG63_10735 [Xanthomonadales bacterium]|nr:hypothetical protein [Xanthomonadales bacterium]